MGTNGSKDTERSVNLGVASALDAQPTLCQSSSVCAKITVVGSNQKNQKTKNIAWFDSVQDSKRFGMKLGYTPKPKRICTLS